MKNEKPDMPHPCFILFDIWRRRLVRESGSIGTRCVAIYIVNPPIRGFGLLLCCLVPLVPPSTPEFSSEKLTRGARQRTIYRLYNPQPCPRGRRTAQWRGQIPRSFFVSRVVLARASPAFVWQTVDPHRSMGRLRHRVVRSLYGSMCSASRGAVTEPCEGGRRRVRARGGGRAVRSWTRPQPSTL